MEIKNVRKIIEQIIVDFPEEYEIKIREEQCYYALWLIAYINIEKNIPEPNITMIKSSALFIKWKNKDRYVTVIIPEEGLPCLLSNEHDKSFKRHDIKEIGELREDIKEMYEREVNE